MSLHEYQHDHECITAGIIHPFMRLRRHHYEAIIIGTWYEFAHQSSPLSQHTLRDNYCAEVEWIFTQTKFRER